MKKLLLTTAAVALTAASAFSQGTVVFANSSTTPVVFGTTATSFGQGDVSGAPLPSGTRFMVELYYAPDGGDPGDLGMQRGQMGATVGIAALPPNGGQYRGGTRTTPSSTAPGARAWFQVRAWETAFGTSYESAAQAGLRDVGGTTRGSYLGTSSRFNIATGAVTPTPLTTAGGVGQFEVNAIVPEPSTIALGILGGLGTLFLLRRRK
jgi:hypothetical protein